MRKRVAASTAITTRCVQALLNNHFRQCDLGHERKYWRRNDGKRTTSACDVAALPGLVVRSRVHSRSDTRAGIAGAYQINQDAVSA